MANPQLPKDNNFASIPVLAPDGANQTIKLGSTGSSSQTAAILNVKVVRIVADAAVSLEFGTNPVAVLATSLYLPANTPEYFKWTSGNLVAAIGTANVYITPVS